MASSGLAARALILLVIATPAPIAADAPPNALSQEVDHRWNQGDPAWYAGRTDRLACVLSGFTGRFKGLGESVRVHAVNGLWQISGSSNQTGVSGWVTCRALSRFKLPGTAKSRKYWTSAEFGRSSRTKDGKTCNNFTVEDRLWQGDAASFITGVTGAMRGTGEIIRVFQSNHPEGWSLARSRRCSGELGVRAHSLFVGVPGTFQSLRFVGPGGTGSADKAGEYVSKPNGSVVLPNARTAMCFLTEVSGFFDGSGELVRIEEEDEFHEQYLITRHNSGQGVYAKVRCVAYDQA